MDNYAQTRVLVFKVGLILVIRGDTHQKNATYRYLIWRHPIMWIALTQDTQGEDLGTPSSQGQFD